MNFLILFIGLFTNYIFGCVFCKNFFFKNNEAVLENFFIKNFFGFFFTSSIYFFLLFTFNISPLKILLTELFFLIIFLYFSKSYLKIFFIDKFRFNLKKIRINFIENKIIYFFLAIYSFIFFFRNIKSPHGEIDAINHWGRGARFLFRDNEFWTNNFDLRFLFQTDYPLFIQSTVSRIWSLLNFETQLVPITIHYLFFLGFPLIFYKLIKKIFSHNISLISTLFLICFPFYSQVAMSHYADIQISFFMFLSVFFAFNLFINEKNNINPNLFFFLGFLTGITSWIKSEGIIFSLIVFLSLIFVFYLYKEKFFFKKIFYSIFGFFISFIPYLTLHSFFITKTEILRFQTLSDKINFISDYQNVLDVLKCFFMEMIKFNNYSLILLISSIYFLGFQFRKKKHIVFIFSILFIFLLSYIFFYIFLTPLDPVFHIKTSLNRILFQYHPIIILAFFSLHTKIKIKNKF